MSAAEPFDLAELGRCVDRAREDAGLTAAELSRRVGVSTTTIRRLHSAADAEADGVLALVRWLGVAPEHFVDGSPVAGAELPEHDGGFIRVDMALVAALTPAGRSVPTGSRTTIQRLAVAARSSGRTIASLTRWSPT
ncbi:MAG: helix-turn-helix transcriptional regulator [Actinomycetota bacterium]